jgi:hypothetical protein
MNTIDSQTGILQRSAMCVQRFDDSRKAIHTTYRISLRSSSLREPRDPLSKVVSNIFYIEKFRLKINLGFIRFWATRTSPNRTHSYAAAQITNYGAQGVKSILAPSQELTESSQRICYGHQDEIVKSVMIQPQVHLRLPCYDF